MKNLLIIANQFCPKGGIGTRRWTKFAKYLARNGGIHVHVLAAQYPYQDAVNWCHDLQETSSITIHRIPGNYPPYLLRPQRNIFTKVTERILRRTLYPIDQAQQWGPTMRRAAARILREHAINHLVITGPPFSPLPTLRPLKQAFPHLKIFMDYRDPWIFWVEKQRGADTHLARRVERLEQQVLATAERLMVTTPEIQKMYRKRFPAFADKVSVLPNAFDPDDLPQAAAPHTPGDFHFVYAGTMLPNRSRCLKLLAEAIHELNDPFFTQKMRIDIYGFKYMPPQIEEAEVQKIYHTIITHRGPLSPQELFKRMAAYPFALLINVPERPGIVPAKTYDYIGLSHKIFLIAPPCALSNFIQGFNQYTSTIDLTSIKEALLRMKEDYQQGRSVRITQEQIQDHSYPAATRQLLDYLEEAGF